MKKLYFLFALLITSSLSFGQDLIITAVFDGPLSGGTPKGVELYAVNAIPDLSIYGIGSANNGDGSDGEELTFPADNIPAGTYLYVASEATQFTAFFGFAPNYTTGAMAINGDDAIELFQNGSVIDIYGDINTDGTGELWDYADGWAYRVDGTGPDGTTFEVLHWTYSGTDALDGATDNATATTPVPVGTYSTSGSMTPTVNAAGNPGNLFYFLNNGPSNPGQFTVSGTNLTNNLDVNATGPEFEFSLMENGTYASSVSIAPNMGTVDPTPVFVRLVAGLSVNSYAADATISSTGATSQTIGLTGTVAPDDPFITISGGVSTLTYNEGSGPSAPDSFDVSGRFLTEDITVNAPANFEISLSSNSGYGSSLMLMETGGEVMSTEVFIRLVDMLAVGMYSGDVVATSTGATDETLSVDGEVFPGATCSNVGDIIITEIMKNPVAVSDNNGEYFEVYNTTGSPIDMLGWVISDFDSDSHTITSSVVVPANGYAVFGTDANFATNGGVTVNYEYSSYFLSNGADEVQIACNSTVIDAVAYDDSNFPDTDGVSMELSTNAFDDVSNDSGMNWGNATSAYGDGDLGTPGSPNDFTLSVNQFEVNTFKVFPNPSNTGQITIAGADGLNLNVAVFDILGQRVISQEIVSNNTLNISALNAGVYLIKIDHDNASTTKKLVIK